MSQDEPAFERATWKERLAIIVDTMRDISRERDPQVMVRTYGKKMSLLNPTDGMVSISRRGLAAPFYRIARSSLWTEEVNPWNEREKLPVLNGGLLGELAFSGEPRIIDDLRVDDDDPGLPFLTGMRSLVAIPVFDEGVALNTVVFMRRRPRGFDPDYLPEMVWTTNLLGRATHNLVLRKEIERVNQQLDREMTSVAEIQQSLLPAALPAIPTLDLAVSYRTARRAGGDYYDFFELPGGRWGILIADVSGHGPPAAVVMGITHSLAHTYAGPPVSPSHMLEHLNRHLESLYTSASGGFVTVFYGTYDPATRELVSACAGHNPPRILRGAGNQAILLGRGASPPLGIVPNQVYRDETVRLESGDRVVLYTDGITEARDSAGAFFGTARLDEIVTVERDSAQAQVDEVIRSVDQFLHGRPPHDDQTLLIARVS